MDETKIFPRDMLPALLKWLDRKEIYIIKGPRQSGKTTILNMIKEKLLKKGVDEKNIIFLNFEDPDILERFEKNPLDYIKSFLLEKKKYYFLIDEYHYVKGGGKKLKLLYDTFENVKFIITGSSSLEIAGAVAKFLVGRVFFFELFPFNFHEFLAAKDPRLAKIYEERHLLLSEFLLGKNFKFKEDIFIDEFTSMLDEYIMFGGYPAVIKANDVETKKMVLKNIYDTYVSKDVVEFLKVADAFKYRCVVRTVALLVGNMLNYNELASTCKSYYKEIKRILSLLSETYIIKLLQPFYKNPVTELKKIPKVYFFDSGLRNHIINNFLELGQRADAGSLIENFVFLSLRNSFPDQTINYWRTIARAEVDFIINLGNELIPVEVKYKMFEKPKASRGLINFIKTYKPRRVVVATKNFWGEKKVGTTMIKFVPVCYF